MKYIHYAIIVVAIILAAWFTFQMELFAHEFRTGFLYQGDWMSFIMVMVLAVAVGGIFKLLAGMTAHRRKKK